MDHSLSREAALARIALSEERENKAAQLSVQALDELCLSLPQLSPDQEVLRKAAPENLYLREDLPAASLSRDRLLQNTFRKEQGCFFAPAAFGEENVSAQAASLMQGSQHKNDFSSTSLNLEKNAAPTVYSPLSLKKLSLHLQEKSLTAQELLELCLSRIREQNPCYNLFIELFRDEALQAARQSDERRAAGRPLSPLEGIPFAIKDQFCFEGHHCECASRMAEGFCSPYTASSVQKLLDAGMIPIGRVNMDSFAMGSHCEYSCHGASRNPLDPALSPGGSSGGSAAAVACGMVPLALGSDTGGSIRVPAAFCGVCGVKPAYGSISRWGLVAFSSSLDTVGVLAANPEDCAMVLPLLCQADGKDSTLDPALWSENPPCIQNALLWELDLEPQILAALQLVKERLARLNIPVQLAPVPQLQAALGAYHTISSCEAYSNLARFDGLRYGHQAETGDYTASRSEGFGEEVKRRLLMGSHVLSEPSRILQAQAFRRELKKQMEEQLAENRVLITPAAPAGAPKLFSHQENPADAYLCDMLTTPASLCGLPSVCFPVFTEKGRLPVGICITGSSRSLKALLALAQQLQG